MTLRLWALRLWNFGRPVWLAGALFAGVAVPLTLLIFGTAGYFMAAATLLVCLLAPVLMFLSGPLLGIDLGRYDASPRRRRS